MQETRIIWRRTGKEHGEDDGFRLNPPEVVEASLQRKAETLDRVTPETWSWWQVDETLLIEKNRPGEDWPRSDSVLHYHLPDLHLLIVENAYIRRLGADWTWYVHVGDHEWRSDLGVWVFTDLFVDILVHSDLRQHTVVDLDDLARALELGIVSQEKGQEILRHTQALVDRIMTGRFPPDVIKPWRGRLGARGLI